MEPISTPQNPAPSSSGNKVLIGFFLTLGAFVAQIFVIVIFMRIILGMHWAMTPDEYEATGYHRVSDYVSQFIAVGTPLFYFLFVSWLMGKYKKGYSLSKIVLILFCTVIILGVLYVWKLF